MNEKIKFALVCKVSNESQTIVQFIKQCIDVLERSLKDYDHFLIIFVIDSTSMDTTESLITEIANFDKRVVLIRNKDGLSPVDSDLLAYNLGLNYGAEWVADINAGFRHSPEDLMKFIDLMYLDKYNVVMGTRFASDSKYTVESLQRRILSRWGSILARKLLDIPLSDLTSGFIMYRRKILLELLEYKFHSRFHFFQTELKFYTFHLTKNIIEIPISYTTKSKKLKLNVLIDAAQNFLRILFIRYCRINK